MRPSARTRWLLATLLLPFAMFVVVRATPLPDEVTQPPRSTRVVTVDGVALFESLSVEQTRSRGAELESISPHLVHATVASEDHRFFQHWGVDPISIARALWLNAK